MLINLSAQRITKKIIALIANNKTNVEVLLLRCIYLHSMVIDHNKTHDPNDIILLFKVIGELNNLKHLDLSLNDIGDSPVTCYFNLVFSTIKQLNQTLTTLDIGSNNLGQNFYNNSENFILFCQTIVTYNNLECLHLNGNCLNCLNSEQLELLGDSLSKLPKLKSLNLSFNFTKKQENQLNSLCKKIRDSNPGINIEQTLLVQHRKPRPF